MAIQPPKQALTDKQVIQIRNEYFKDLLPLAKLSAAYNVSVPTLRKAIHGVGKYAAIKDTIPLQVKEDRTPHNQRYGTAKIRAKRNMPYKWW